MGVIQQEVTQQGAMKNPRNSSKSDAPGQALFSLLGFGIRREPEVDRQVDQLGTPRHQFAGVQFNDDEPCRTWVVQNRLAESLDAWPRPTPCSAPKGSRMCWTPHRLAYRYKTPREAVEGSCPAEPDGACLGIVGTRRLSGIRPPWRRVRQDTFVFRYRIAESGSPDVDRWLRLRQDVYLETGLIAAGEVDGGTGFYADQYDEYSTHVIASDDSGTDIACSRLIDGGDDHPLQVTDLFGIETEPRSSETSGVAAIPSYRKSWASLGLYRAMSAIAAERGHEYGYAIVEPPYLASLRRIGYPFEVISEPKDVYGYPNVAAVFRRGDLLESMRTAGGPYASLVYRYFSKPFDWTLTGDDLAVSVS